MIFIGTQGRFNVSTAAGAVLVSEYPISMGQKITWTELDPRRESGSYIVEF